MWYEICNGSLLRSSLVWASSGVLDDWENVYFGMLPYLPAAGPLLLPLSIQEVLYRSGRYEIFCTPQVNLREQRTLCPGELIEWEIRWNKINQRVPTVCDHYLTGQKPLPSATLFGARVHWTCSLVSALKNQINPKTEGSSSPKWTFRELYFFDQPSPRGYLFHRPHVIMMKKRKRQEMENLSA